jgi:hypothetical protein
MGESTTAGAEDLLPRHALVVVGRGEQSRFDVVALSDPLQVPETASEYLAVLLDPGPLVSAFEVARFNRVSLAHTACAIAGEPVASFQPWH